MKHILLVEPDKKMAAVAKEYLEKDGKIKVRTAYSAQEGIHSADKQTPMLVIVELAIPMHNGFAFLHEFRSYSDWVDIPVIVHSHIDIDRSSASAEWKRLGVTTYFYKPTTTLKKLKNAADEALDL